jgi:hypothetical protein
MSHLTDQQVLEYVAGHARPEWRDHIRLCPECATQARQLSEPLRLFADSVRAVAPVHLDFRLSQPRRRIAYWPAFVAAALLLLIAAPFYRARQVRVAHPVAAVSDEVLLQRVQTAVAESVPGPMAPLAVTLTTDSGHTE